MSYFEITIPNEYLTPTTKGVVNTLVEELKIIIKSTEKNIIIFTESFGEHVRVVDTLKCYLIPYTTNI